jgi:ABC-2 type transport system permease protein
MKRYLTLYKTFVTTSLVREMEFRANFIAKIISSLMWVVFFLLILLVIYRNTTSIAGWSRADSLILSATCFGIHALMGAMFFSLTEIPNHVRQGTLDFIVTKPVDSQFWVSTRRFNFDKLGALFAGVVLLVVGLQQSGASPSLLQWVCYVTLSLCSFFLFYSLNLALMTTGIWLVKVENLWVLSESVLDLSRFPIDIYGAKLVRVLTYFIPLAFIATLPSRQLTQSADLTMVGVGLLWAGGALLASRWFWRFAMRHYSSASS